MATLGEHSISTVRGTIRSAGQRVRRLGALGRRLAPALALPLLLAGQVASTSTAMAAPARDTVGAPTEALASGPAEVGATASSAAPRLLFGIGTEADSAMRARLTNESPVRMLSSWYNGPDDLRWITGWKKDLVPNSYAAGYALHLIVFNEDKEQPISTQYGTACGRPYPLSDRFLGDMRQLAQTFAGNAGGPALYVTMFTEVQTYACTDNSWNPNPETNAYWRALKDQYTQAMAIFHQEAPNAKVSLGWGGWQARWDEPGIGGGRSLFSYFDDVMRASDFQSFQAMQNDSNATDVRAMTRLLGQYGPVLLAHYKPDNRSQATFDADVRAILTDSFLAEVTSAGLFGVSFMDQQNMSASEPTYQLIRESVQRFGGTIGEARA